MVETPRRKGLGRGLAALIDDVRPVGGENGSAQRSAPIEKLHPNPEQPRRRFTEEEIESLATSIGARGVIQPLVVRPHPSLPDAWQIVAGERRWRAAQRAGLHDLPIVEMALSDADVLEVAIIENVQRADLNPMEEASGYAQLIERFGHTQDQIAESLGKSRSHIANMLRLLQSPPTVRAMVEDGRLTAGHARALLGAPEPEALAARIVSEGLSVREAERLARGAKQPAASSRASRVKDPDTAALEADIGAVLGMRVEIDHRGESGAVRIHYRTLDQLDGLCRLLNRTE